MKLNVFSYVFWPEHFLINEICEELSTRHQIEVSVQTSLPNYQTGHLAQGYTLLKGPYFEKHQQIKIYRYPVWPRKKGFIHLALNYFSNILFGGINFLRLPPSRVYLHFATSPLIFILPIVIIKKITGARLIIWYQDLWPESFFAITKKQNKYLQQFLEVLVRFIYRNTDFMLLQNRGFLENLKKYEYTGPVEVMYNWAPNNQKKIQKKDQNSEGENSFRRNFEIDLSRDEEFEVIEFDGYQKANHDFNLVFAGNLGKAQSLDAVLNVMRRLQDKAPQVKLYLAGDGSELNNLTNFIEKHNLKNTIYLGRKPVEKMPELYQFADVVIVSLKKDPVFQNVIPSKIQSYMLEGRPILGFLDGAGADVIREAEAGLVASAENEKELESAILEFFNMPKSKRNNLGRNGYSFYELNFKFEIQVAKLLKVLKDKSN